MLQVIVEERDRFLEHVFWGLKESSLLARRPGKCDGSGHIIIE